MQSKNRPRLFSDSVSGGRWGSRRGRLMRQAVDSPLPHRLRLGGSPLRGKRCAFVQVALQPSATLPAMRHGNHGILTATGRGREAPELLHKKGTRLGIATRPLADLTAPLAPGRSRGTGSEVSSPLGAREPKGLRRRLRPLRPGFRVCSTTALALQAPGEPGSSSISRNWAGVKLHLPAQRKAPDWVPFFVLEHRGFEPLTCCVRCNRSTN